MEASISEVDLWGISTQDGWEEAPSNVASIPWFHSHGASSVPWLQDFMPRPIDTGVESTRAATDDYLFLCVCAQFPQYQIGRGAAEVGEELSDVTRAVAISWLLTRHGVAISQLPSPRVGAIDRGK